MGVSKKGKRKVEVSGKIYLWRIKTSRKGVLQLEIIDEQARKAAFIPLSFKDSVDELCPEMKKVISEYHYIHCKNNPGTKILSITPIMVKLLIPHLQYKFIDIKSHGKKIEVLKTVFSLSFWK